MSLADRAHHSQCLILSAKAPSGMAFFRKLSMDFSNAARCGKHCTPVTTQSSVSISRQLTLLIHHLWSVLDFNFALYMKKASNIHQNPPMKCSICMLLLFLQEMNENTYHYPSQHSCKRQQCYKVRHKIIIMVITTSKMQRMH